VDELNRCLDELEHYQTTTRNLGSMAVQKVTIMLIIITTTIIIIMEKIGKSVFCFNAFLLLRSDLILFCCGKVFLQTAARRITYIEFYILFRLNFFLLGNCCQG